MPVKSGTVVHMQAAYAEAISSICQALTGSYDPTKVYVLSGCVNTGTGSNYIISAGSVFFNGEVYQVPAATFTIVPPQVAEGTITVSFFSAYNADSVQFTDGVLRNVHQIRQIIMGAALAGSGAGDFVNFIRLVLNTPVLNLTGTGLASVSGTYPNKVIDVEIPFRILASDIVAVGDVSSGTGTDIAVVFGAPLLTVGYMVAGSIESLGTPQGDTQVTWSVRNKTLTGFTLHFAEYNATVQDIQFAYQAISLT